MKAKTVFVSFYNEIFIYSNNKPFNRNRLYGAVGYQFTPLFNIQLGYFAQTVIQQRNRIYRLLFYKLDFKIKIIKI